MGIDAGIVVVKQITDEYKWFQAMEEIRNDFEENLYRDYFRILPRFNKEDFTVEAFENYMQAEELNFSTNGSTFEIDWTVFHKIES